MFQRKQNNQFTQGQTRHLKLNSVWKLIWDQKPTYQDSYQECVGIFHCTLLCTSYLLIVSFRHRKVSTCRSICICIEELFLFKVKFLKIVGGGGRKLPRPLLFSPLLMLLNLCYHYDPSPYFFLLILLHSTFLFLASQRQNLSFILNYPDLFS